MQPFIFSPEWLTIFMRLYPTLPEQTVQLKIKYQITLLWPQSDVMWSHHKRFQSLHSGHAIYIGVCNTGWLLLRSLNHVVKCNINFLLIRIRLTWGGGGGVVLCLSQHNYSMCFRMASTAEMAATLSLAKDGLWQVNYIRLALMTHMPIPLPSYSHLLPWCCS